MALHRLSWSTWTLRTQVTCVIVLVVLTFETASVGLDYLQIRADHKSEVSNRGGAFVQEVLPALIAEAVETRADVASSFSSSERTLRTGQEPGTSEEDATRLHPDIATALADRLRADGFEVESMLVADRRIEATDSDHDVFGAFFSQHQSSTQETDEDASLNPENVAILSLRLPDDPTWYNFYILTEPMNTVPLLMAASLDTGIALFFTFAMIALVGRVLGPMRALSEGAEQLGRGEKVDVLPPEGSKDVRETVVAFNRMSERVRHAYDYQSSLIQSLGHDLRGPLDRVRRLAKTTSPEQIRDDLLQRINSVDDIVGSVTSFTRATRRDGTLVRVDLPSLLDALVEEQLDLGHQSSLDVKAAVTVKGRHSALTRALRNLVENAVKYGTVARVTLDRTDRFAVITVDDDGKGIAPDQLESAFRPFERLNAEGPGSGLGLAIVKAIVVDHGGEIELANRAPSGLRATIRLPLDPMEISRTEKSSLAPTQSQ